MATIPQQLIAIAEAAKKAGAKTGRETADYTRKHAPQLAKDYISHLHLAHKMLRKPAQFGPAIEAVRKGASGTLAAIAKPYQNAPVPRGTGTPTQAPKAAQARRADAPSKGGSGAGLDARLADALGLGNAASPPTPRARKRRADPPPTIADAVFQQMFETVKASAKKASSKK